MDNNYVMLALVCGLCAIVGIYYCWVRKLNTDNEPHTAASQSRTKN
jgi:hypothetical protein